MRRLLAAGGGALCVLFAAGCRSCLEVRGENELLRKDNEELAAKVDSLEVEQGRLVLQNRFLKKKNEALDREKHERSQDLQRLRAGLSRVLDSIRSVLESRREDVDYYGGELCERHSTEVRSGILLVDRRNKIEHRVRVVGGRAIIAAPTAVIFSLLRPQPGNPARAEVVYKSETLFGENAGLQEWNFQTPFDAEPGDYIALYAVDSANIPYDTLGSGDVAGFVMTEPKVSGQDIPVDAAEEPEPRTYSFGVIGYLR